MNEELLARIVAIDEELLTLGLQRATLLAEKAHLLGGPLQRFTGLSEDTRREIMGSIHLPVYYDQPSYEDEASRTPSVSSPEKGAEQQELSDENR